MTEVADLLGAMRQEIEVRGPATGGSDLARPSPDGALSLCWPTSTFSADTVLTPRPAAPCSQVLERKYVAKTGDAPPVPRWSVAGKRSWGPMTDLAK